MFIFTNIQSGAKKINCLSIKITGECVSQMTVFHFTSLKKKTLQRPFKIRHECSIIMNSFHCSYKKTCCFPCRRNLFLQCSEDSCPVRWSKVSGAKLVKGTFCRPSWSMVYMATTGERKSVYHSTSPITVQKIHTVLTQLSF